MEVHVLIKLAYQYADEHIVSMMVVDSCQIDNDSRTYYAIRELSHYYQLSDEKQLVLLLASCFLKQFSSQGKAKLLEDRITHLSKFQKLYYLDSKLIAQVSRCMKNCASGLPVTLEERILCDAMNYHLSNCSFVKPFDQQEKDKQKITTGRNTKLEGVEVFIGKLLSHRFHTNYAQQYFNPGLNQNLSRLQMLITE